MPIRSYENHTAALNSALEQLRTLRQTLDFIRAETPRKELAETVRSSQGVMAALLEELEESIVHRSGYRLTILAEQIEAELRNQGRQDDEAIWSIAELWEQAKAHEQLALDRDYRVLGQAWQDSCFADQLQSRLERMVLLTDIGHQTAKVLVQHYDDAKARFE